MIEHRPIAMRLGAIALALLVTLIAPVAAATWWPDSFRTVHQEQGAPSSEEPQKEQPQENILSAFWHWTTEDPAAAYTAVLTLFTGVLAFGTFLLVTDGRKHSERELRAYISVEPSGLNQVWDALSYIGHVKIRNAGKVPARDVVVAAVTAHDRGEPSSVTTNVSIGVIQPGVVIEFGPNQTSSNVVRNEDYIYAFGTVTYFDGFSPTRRTTSFNHRYPWARLEHMSPHGDEFISIKYARYDKGNDAD